MNNRFAAITLIGLGWTLLNNSWVAARDSCPALSANDRSRLVGYVKRRYKIPQRTPLSLADASIANSSCYRKLRFESSDPAKSWGILLFLSPDRRFLSHELLDSSMDPVEEERQKERELAAALTQGDPPAIGMSDAPVTLTVFSDFQCPYCARFAATLSHLILPTEGPRVKLVFRHFPLSMHNWARPAAEAAACAQEQGVEHFWKLHDLLFDKQRELNGGEFKQKLQGLVSQISGLDQEKFYGCVSEKRASGRVEHDITLGRLNGVDATPTVFINGRRVEQVVAPEQIRTLIRQAAMLAKSNRPSRER